MELSVQKTEGQKQKPSRTGEGGGWGVWGLGGVRFPQAAREKDPRLSPCPAVGKEVLWSR